MYSYETISLLDELGKQCHVLYTVCRQTDQLKLSFAILYFHNTIQWKIYIKIVFYVITCLHCRRKPSPLIAKLLNRWRSLKDQQLRFDRNLRKKAKRSDRQRCVCVCVCGSPPLRHSWSAHGEGAAKWRQGITARYRSRCNKTRGGKHTHTHTRFIIKTPHTLPARWLLKNPVE